MPSITHFPSISRTRPTVSLSLSVSLSLVLLVSGGKGPISASVWSLEKPYTRQRWRDRAGEKGGNGVTWSLWFVYSIQRSLAQAQSINPYIHTHTQTHKHSFVLKSQSSNMQCDDVIPSNSTRTLLALPSWKWCLWNYGRLLSKEKMATGYYTLRHKVIMDEREKERGSNWNRGTDRQTVFQLKLWLLLVNQEFKSRKLAIIYMLKYMWYFCLFDNFVSASWRENSDSQTFLSAEPLWPKI